MHSEDADPLCQIITMGKASDPGSHTRAANFLLKPVALQNLFETFAKRYADRPGGYTRVLKLGNRKGDNAPQAVLELVDSPQDLRFEMTARAAGWDILQHKIEKETLGSVVKSGAEEAKEILASELKLAYDARGGVLRPQTRLNVQKLLKFRGEEGLALLSEKVAEHAVRDSSNINQSASYLPSYRTGFLRHQWR
mgnify:CR=1 FL=1